MLNRYNTEKQVASSGTFTLLPGDLAGTTPDYVDWLKNLIETRVAPGEKAILAYRLSNLDLEWTKNLIRNELIFDIELHGIDSAYSALAFIRDVIWAARFFNADYMDGFHFPQILGNVIHMKKGWDVKAALDLVYTDKVPKSWLEDILDDAGLSVNVKPVDTGSIR